MVGEPGTGRRDECARRRPAGQGGRHCAGPRAGRRGAVHATSGARMAHVPRREANRRCADRRGDAAGLHALGAAYPRDFLRRVRRRRREWTRRRRSHERALRDADVRRRRSPEGERRQRRATCLSPSARRPASPPPVTEIPRRVRSPSPEPPTNHASSFVLSRSSPAHRSNARRTTRARSGRLRW